MSSLSAAAEDPCGHGREAVSQFLVAGIVAEALLSVFTETNPAVGVVHRSRAPHWSLPRVSSQNGSAGLIRSHPAFDVYRQPSLQKTQQFIFSSTSN